MKILHGPVNVGNQPWILSRHERALGAKSDLVVNYDTWINYNADRVLGNYGDASIGGIVRRAVFGFLAPFKYDVLHFYFGRSMIYWDDLGKFNILPYADLKIAKALGKKVFMTLQGCDVRLASASSKRNQFTACAHGMCTAFEQCVSTYDLQRLEMIDQVLPLCDQVFYLNPELGHFVPDGVFLPYASSEIEYVQVIPPNIDRIPRIIHAPTNGGIKGTRLIIDALKVLESEFEFELDLVVNKPHEEALRLYRDADIAIDQVLTGWYGGFAVEMMALGKPVMCWIREGDLNFVPSALCADLPLLNIRPDRLVDDIRNILINRKKWLDWSRTSRDYVLRWHNPRRIASLLLETYKNPRQKFDLASLLSDKNL